LGSILAEALERERAKQAKPKGFFARVFEALDQLPPEEARRRIQRMNVELDFALSGDEPVGGLRH
jgi:hypothetical protein